MKKLSLLWVVLLGFLIISIGGMMGDNILGDFLSIVGAVGIVFSIVEYIKSRKKSSKNRVH